MSDTPHGLTALENEFCQKHGKLPGALLAAKLNGPATFAAALGLPEEFVRVALSMGVEPAAVALNRKRNLTAAPTPAASSEPTRGIVFGAGIPIELSRR